MWSGPCNQAHSDTRVNLCLLLQTNTDILMILTLISTGRGQPSWSYCLEPLVKRVRKTVRIFSIIKDASTPPDIQNIQIFGDPHPPEKKSKSGIP